MHNYFTNIYEARYVSGVVAGLKLNEMIEDGTVKEDACKMGYVGAFPYAEVISGYTAFYLGAKSVCPSVTMEVKYTNSWASFDLEKECADALISDGCVLISQHADSMGAPTACETAGVPNVSYKVYDKKGNCMEVHNPGGLPDPTQIDHIEEPYIRASVITNTAYIGPIMTLCLGKRGILLRQEYISGHRIEIHYDLPLGEIVIDFYDKLKSISKGYASFDYHIHDFRESKLAKLDILLNGEPVDALSTLTHVDNSVTFGRRMCEKLKELIPRQQFDIAIQAAIGAKIVARETVKQVRKDVTAKCYGGDVSRKRKLLEKQKKGKKRMKQIGNVEVPQKAFLAVLKLD